MDFSCTTSFSGLYSDNGVRNRSLIQIWRISNVLASYHFPEFRFSYLKTKDDTKIDLIVERPGKKILFIEIKSSQNVSKEQLASFSQLAKDFGECEAVCLSRDKRAKKFDTILVLPWAEGVKKYFQN